MNIHFTCPGCGASYFSSPTDAGKLVDCKRCGLRQNVPNFPPQTTIRGEVLRPSLPHNTTKATTLADVILPHEKSDSRHSTSGVIRSEKLKNSDATEQTSDFVSFTARRSRSKTGQLIFFIIGGLAFLGLGILVLAMIAHRAEELKTEVASEKNPESPTSFKTKTNSQAPEPSPNAKKPVFEDKPIKKELVSGPKADIELLIKQLSDRDEIVRLKAAEELGRLKEKAKDAIPALTAATKDDDERVRAVAKKSLASVKDSAKEKATDNNNDHLADLIIKLKSKDIDDCLFAIAKLESMGADATPAGAALVQYGMMNPNPKIAEAANNAFEKIDPVVHKYALTVYVDENWEIRDRAINTLRYMGAEAKAAIPVIKSYYDLHKKRENYPRFHLIQALVAIAPEDIGVQNIVLKLIGESREANPELIKQMHLLKINNKQKYAVLMEGLEGCNHNRKLLISELADLGPDAKEALPTLQKLKLDKEQAVREAAVEAIKAIKE